MIGAYDLKTGKISVGSSDRKVSADLLDKRTVDYVENKLGVKIGEITTMCPGNVAGACAEVWAADKLIRQGVDPSDIKFTKAVIPRKIKQYGNVINEYTIKPTCKNCKITWKEGVK